jgi:hypothetical protein
MRMLKGRESKKRLESGVFNQPLSEEKIIELKDKMVGLRRENFSSRDKDSTNLSQISSDFKLKFEEF